MSESLTPEQLDELGMDLERCHPRDKQANLLKIAVSMARRSLQLEERLGKIRNMCEAALDPTGMRLGENNGTIYAQCVVDILDGPKGLHPPAPATPPVESDALP